MIKTRTITTLLSVGAVLLSTAAMARADSGPSCGYWTFDGNTPAIDAALQECGFTKIPLSGTSTLPGGGMAYNYTAPDGEVVSVTKTPPGFNAQTASASVDATYGVPPQPPTLAAEHASWVSRVANWQTAPTELPYLLASPNMQATTVYDDNWSGYVQPAASGSPWQVADAQYAEPELESTPCSNPALAIWSGIGGTGTEPLAQVGTWSGGTWPLHTAWHELLPGQGAIPFRNPDGTIVTATKGQSVDATTQWLGYTSGYNNFSLSISIGNNVYGVIDGSDRSYARSTAEEIVETPKIDGQFTPLMYFDPMSLYGDNGLDSIPLGSNADRYLFNGGYDTVGPLDHGNFPVHWDTC